MIDLRRAGAVERPDGEGVAGGPACGDRVRFTLALERGRLARVRFGADACLLATAAAAWLAAAAEDAPFLHAAGLGTEAVLQALELPPAARSHVEVAVDALGAALGDAVVRGVALDATPGLAAVAMSGGSTPPWCSPTLRPTAPRSGSRCGCGSTRRRPTPTAPAAPTAARRARDACHARGVPHLALDLREPFRQAVVEPFVADYAAGATPNPCVRCNGDFRFEALLAAAAGLGAERLLTGHYARIDERDGIRVVARGADPCRDESYMLARLDPCHLARLGSRWAGSRRTRRRPRPGARPGGRRDAAESQEVRFLGGGDYRGFLRRAGGSATARWWTRRGANWAVDGAAGFTPVRARGGGAADQPLYVLRTDTPANVVVVAPTGRLPDAAAGRRPPARPAHPRRRQAALPLPAVAATVDRAPRSRSCTSKPPAFGIAPGQPGTVRRGRGGRRGDDRAVSVEVRDVARVVAVAAAASGLGGRRAGGRRWRPSRCAPAA